MMAPFAWAVPSQHIQAGVAKERAGLTGMAQIEGGTSGIVDHPHALLVSAELGNVP